MSRSWVARSCLAVLLVLGLCRPGAAQIIPFTSGPIPLCDTSTFTANVSGIGMLYPPGYYWYSYWISQLTINITSDHPQTLQIFLTSPEGTELLLSEFNGAGGQNYTNTTFTYGGNASITTGTAPFTGYWTAQGGPLSAFDYEYADGTWTITVIDTACANGGTGPGGTWTPGWFNGAGGGNGGFAFGFNAPPPCWGGIPSGQAVICPGETVDILGYYTTGYYGYTYNITYGGSYVADPSAVTQPGTYFVDAWDMWDGCGYWADFTVYAGSPGSLGPDEVVDHCSSAGSVNLSALVSITGPWPEWSLNGTTISAWTAYGATSPGVYQVIDNAGTNCSDTATVTLNILPAPALGPDQPVSTCPGTSVDLSTSYNTAGLTANWTFQGYAFLTPTAATSAGVYSLVVTNGDGCTDQANVTLTVQASPSLGADQGLDLCGNTSLDLTALYTTTGLTTSWTLMGVPVANPASVTSAGTYQLVASNGSACTDVALVSVNVVAPPALGSDAATAICAGNAADLTTTFTTTGLSTAWTTSGSVVPDPSSVSTVGLYTLIATSTAGCSDTASVDVTVSPNPVLGADQLVSICPGAGTDLTTLYNTTGLIPSWTFQGSPFQTPTAATAAGVYTLTATNGGCSDQADVTLAVLPPPSLGADQGLDQCGNASLDLTALYNTTGLTTAWTLFGVPVANPASVSIGGTYQLVATDGSGCTDAADVSVNVIAPPSLGSDASAGICAGNAADLTATFNTTGLTTTWTISGSAVPDPSSVSTVGLYTLIATTAAGCSDTANVDVTVSANPVLGADQLVSICPGASTDLSALYNTTGLIPSWTFQGTSFTTPTAATAAGVYSLVATNSAGCADQADVTLALLAPPLLGADQSLDLCGNASLDLTALYNTSGLSTSWTLLGIPVGNPGAVSFAGTYQLVASNSSGCTDGADVSVNVIAPPSLGPDASSALCDGSTADLTTTFITTGLITAWTLSGSAVPDPAAVSAGGLYTLMATSAVGCTDTAHVDLTPAANPVVGPDQLVAACDGAVVDLTILYFTGTNATTWTANGVPVADPAAITTDGTYILTATNAAGCTTDVEVTLELALAPALGADQPASICGGSTFDLTAVYSTAGLTTAWTRNGAAVGDPTSVTITGNYQLVATTAFGCTDTAAVALTVNPNPSLGADQWFSLCPWQTVDLSTVFPVAGVYASYTLDGQFVADPTAVSDSGTYVITVTDANGCVDEAIASVVPVECMCVADFKDDAQCFQEPVQFTLLADSAVLAAHWDLSGVATSSTEIDPLIRFTSEGEVLVTLEATLSCGVVRVERTIQLQDCADACTVWIPSAFSPDNNTRNDAWTWYGACEPEDFFVEIYSRWGELIFTTNDPLDAWDGTYHGAASPPGVYAYHVGYRLPYQKRKEVLGSITLVR